MAWWPLEGSGADVIGQNDGTLAGNPVFTSGQVGQGMRFDGVNDWVRVSTSTALNVGAGDGFTLEGWINPADLSRLRPIAEWNSGSIGVHFWTGVDMASPGDGERSLFANLIDASGGSHPVRTPKNLLNTGTWQHVALAYNKASGEAAIYHNGVVAAEANLGSFTPLTSGDLNFGNRPSGPFSGVYWQGGMDEVSIYSRALLPSEIQSISASGPGGKCRPVRPPAIVAQPSDRTVTVGDSATFSITATGTAPLQYQWLFEGAPIAGATNASLTLENVQMSQAGNYSMAVSNELGATNSAPATLTVVFPAATLRLADSQGGGGTSIPVPVLLSANGNENALGFSIQFDPLRLSFERVEVGLDAPAGMAIVANPTDAANGRVGIAVALEANATFPSGTQEIVRVVFAIAPTFTAVNTPLAFGNNPTVRQISDSEARILAGNYVGGTVLIHPTELEGDVAPRPDGDRTTTIIDWVQMGRFVAGLNTISSSNEFQRADCAPRSTRGNGVLGVTDWVQTGRYAAGLDPATPVGGPTEELLPAPLFQAAASGARILKLADATALPGTTSNVPVKLAAQGNENALGFSVAFDPTKLRFISGIAGSAATDAVLNLNTSQSDQGRIGLVLALPAGRVFTAGEREVVNLRFAPLDPVTGTTPLEFTDAPVRREISDAQAEPLPAAFAGATISFQPAGPSLSLNLSADTLVLFWPAEGTDAYELESSPQLQPAEWMKVNTRPIVIGGQRIVTVPATAGQAWFRLKKP